MDERRGHPLGGGTMKVFAVFDERKKFIRAISNEQNAISATPQHGERVEIVLQRDEKHNLWRGDCTHGTLYRRDMSGWEFSTVKDEPEKPKSLNKQKKVYDAKEDE